MEKGFRTDVDSNIQFSYLDFGNTCSRNEILFCNNI